MPGIALREFECTLCQDQFTLLSDDLMLPEPDICDECLRKVWPLEGEELANYVAERLACEPGEKETLVSTTVQYITRYKEQWRSADEAIDSRERERGFLEYVHHNPTIRKEAMVTSTSDYASFQLGVSLHMLDREQRLDTMGILSGSSVKAVELWEPTFEKEDSFVQEARQALAMAGVEPRTVHANFGRSLDISSPDDATRSAGICAISAALDLASRMGAQIVIVHPSSEPIGSHARDSRMAESKRSIETIVDMARQAGCRIALELLPRTCLGRSATELLELLEGVDAATAGVCLDTNHLMDRFASLPEVVHSLGSRLIALHCSDYDGVDEKHWLPLRGVIDWPAFLSALSETGFSGPLHYETHLDGQTAAERLALLEANFAQVVDGWE